VRQNSDERNFHGFYQLLRGADQSYICASRKRPTPASNCLLLACAPRRLLILTRELFHFQT
jgi:hypothetical protein